MQLADAQIHGEWYAKTAGSAPFNAIQPEDSLKWPSYEWMNGQYESMFFYVRERFTDFARVSARRCPPGPGGGEAAA